MFRNPARYDFAPEVCNARRWEPTTTTAAGAISFDATPVVWVRLFSAFPSNDFKLLSALSRNNLRAPQARRAKRSAGRYRPRSLNDRVQCVADSGPDALDGYLLQDHAYVKNSKVIARYSLVKSNRPPILLFTDHFGNQFPVCC